MATNDNIRELESRASRLIHHNEIDTVSHCAAVIEMMTAVDLDDAPGNAGFGSFLVLSGVADALRHAVAQWEANLAERLKGTDHAGAVSPETNLESESIPDRVFYRLNSIIAVSDLLAESGGHGTFSEGSLQQIGVLLSRTAEELLNDVTVALKAGPGRPGGAS